MDIVRDWRLPVLDPYSFTQDVPWVNHEWLSEVCLALAYQAGGLTGLFLLKTVILVGAILLLEAVSRQADKRYRWWLLALSVLGMSPLSGTYRPQLWTLLGLAIVSHRLSAGTKLGWLPVVFAIWANLHGGWIVGMGLVALWLAGRAIDQRRISRQAVLVGSLSFVATVINPYGWHLWEFLATTVRPGREVAEWRPIWEVPDLGLIWPLTIAAILVTFVARRHRANVATSLPLFWFALSGLLVARIAPLFSEISLFALAQMLTNGAAAEDIHPRPSSHLVIDFAVVAGLWTWSLLGSAKCLPIKGEWAPDLLAASALSTTSAKGRLITPFNWGQFAIWHWGPTLKVSADGRRETVYSDSMQSLQRAIEMGTPEGWTYLASVRPEYVWLLLPGNSNTAEWLKANGYAIDVQTQTSFVARRLDLAPLSFGPTLAGCFP